MPGATAFGSEFLVNTTTTSYQGLATIAALADGRFVVAWTDYSLSGGDTSEYAVRAQVFNADGSRSGAEFLVNTTTTNFQTEPTITALADGRFVVAWSDGSASGGDTSECAVRAQVFNADGSRSGAEFLVNTTTTNNQYQPTITALADGRFVVAWSDGSASGGDTSDSAVRAQVFNADGSTSGAEFLVNTTTTNLQFEPTITALADGRFVVAWTDFNFSQFGGSDMRAQVFNADGSRSGAEFLVNTTTTQDQIVPTITALADGRFVVAWADGSQSGGDPRDFAVRAQVFNADGSTSGAEFLVNTTTTNRQSEPTITALADGRFVVAWSDLSASGGDTSGSAVRAQVFNADGSTSGAEFLVNTTTTNNQAQPTITALADGRFVVAWTDYSASGGDTAVRGQIFDPREGALILSGTELGDDFVGARFDDFIDGCGGNDEIDGAGGNDTLRGGAGTDALLGGEGNDTLDGGNDTDALNGGDGDDTYVIDSTADVLLDSAGVDLVKATVTKTLEAGFENLTLLGAAAIDGTGNDLANTITGNAAANILDGGTGADILIGGAGDDTYVLGAENDAINDASGIDTIISTITRSLEFVPVENLVLLGAAAIDGTGNDLANIITGNAAANILNGGIGNDLLDGGLGSDILIGGAGDDTYVLGAENDAIVDASGIDTITSTITRSLEFVPVENLVLLGAAATDGTGNGLANTITGNAAANILDGGMGNDLLDGGLGSDTLIGGAGDDTYVLGAENDAINDASGIDTATSTITRSLASFATVENLVLLGSAAINGTGNSLANTITGNAAANILDGGTGVDILIGGAGNDTYVLGAENDAVTDTAGIDTITSTITRSLEFVPVENLVLLGSAAINGTGNSLANTITGNAAANILDGGLGSDTLIGGAGDDTYVLGAENDAITDASGIDTITSTITRSLASFATVENLTLLGNTAIDGTGNELANTITGNAAANILNGEVGNDLLDGGLGSDTLIGGAGDDTYVLGAENDAIADASGIDTITSTITRSLELAPAENLVLLGSAAINGTGNSLGNTITGNAAANILDGGTGVDSLIGGAGNDTYVLGAENDAVTDTAGIDTITSTITRSLEFVPVENLVLLGSAVINGTGNSLANTITGNAAANILDGGTGVDILIGGAGDDTYVLGAENDAISDASGIDTITSTITRSLASFATIENLTLLGAAAIDGTGNDLANTITGNAAANILDGGTGVDILIGGAGDDTYVLGAENDAINDASGIDTITSTITRSLEFVPVENLTLLGSAAINGTGNSLGNTITGNAAANILEGGLGSDTLIGGGGNDTYVLAAENDVINDASGIDTITSTITRSLEFVPVENLVLLGSVAINGTGNSLGNTITGNAAANILDGGTGVDILIGGAGDDTYVLGAENDAINDASGIDTITSTITRSLASFTTIEKLTLLGTTAVNGTGNALANTITGNAAANILDGGAGADTLIGGAGNDTYVLANGADIVNDSAGIDTIKSSITRSLVSFTTVENLTLDGTAAISGTGNALANTITGNAVANTLNGGTGNDILSGGAGNDVLIGGAGKDTMTGGAGNDLFDFDAVADVGNGAARDVIADFAAGFDDIDLSTIDANGAAAGHTFNFLAAKGAAFTGVAGQLCWFQQDFANSASDRTIIEGDTNGDKVADLQLQLTGLKPLTAADFIL